MFFVYFNEALSDYDYQRVMDMIENSNHVFTITTDRAYTEGDTIPINCHSFTEDKELEEAEYECEKAVHDTPYTCSPKRVVMGGGVRDRARSRSFRGKCTWVQRQAAKKRQ